MSYKMFPLQITFKDCIQTGNMVIGTRVTSLKAVANTEEGRLSQVAQKYTFEIDPAISTY